jgi:hypothetical protein
MMPMLPMLTLNAWGTSTAGWHSARAANLSRDRSEVLHMKHRGKMLKPK